MTRRLEQMAPLAAKYTADEKLAIANEAAAQMSASAPRGETGAYAASIQGDKLSNRAGRASVGGGINQTKDPDATGIFADYIWRFLEFGAAGHVIKAKSSTTLSNGSGEFFGPNVKHPGSTARPHIFHNWRAMRKKSAARIRRAALKGVKEALGKK